MLVELRIKDFAIIDEQEITFGAGLNVISGETGAGKSIVLQALQLVLGARGSTDQIRSGQESLAVEALFDLTKIPKRIFEELPDLAKTDELLISRELNSSGRGKVYINGRLGSVGLLEEICSRFMNICSQNQHTRLLESSYHREMIDDFGRNSELLEKYRDGFYEWSRLKERIGELSRKLNENVMRKAELEFLSAELTKLELRPGLRQELEAKVSRLANSQHLIEGVNEAVGVLTSDEDGILGRTDILRAKLSSLQKFDPALGSLSDLAESARISLGELESELSRYLGGLEVDEEALTLLQDKLSSLAGAERKYRTDTDGLIKLLAQSDEELKIYEEGFSLDDLYREERECFEKLKLVSESLTRARLKSAKELSRITSQELSELGMKDASIKVELLPVELNENGAEKVEFMIATNKGEPHKPLRQVASGGELSRVMLVFKKVLNESFGVNVLVFDEVDIGVSGGVARAVGGKLKALAKNSQVVCITHLPQVASLADHHFVVDKHVGKRTSAIVKRLNDPERVDEIARMLAGYTITDAARESARELLTSK